jgi:hypothetical protein
MLEPAPLQPAEIVGVAPLVIQSTNRRLGRVTGVPPLIREKSKILFS